VQKAFLGLWHQDVPGIKLYLIIVGIKMSSRLRKSHQAVQCQVGHVKMSCMQEMVQWYVILQYLQIERKYCQICHILPICGCWMYLWNIIFHYC